MEENITKAPIIALLAASAGGLLILSIAQFHEKKAIQEKALQTLQLEQKETTEVMNKIGRAAERANEKTALAAKQSATEQQKIYDQSAKAQEAQRLDAEDRNWLAAHPLSPSQTQSATH